MKIKDIIVESVIDSKNRFTQLRSIKFQNRIKSFVDDLPQAFARQDELESLVNRKLLEIEQLPNDILGKRALLQLASLRKEFLPNVSLLDILDWVSNDTGEFTEDQVNLARNFIDQNIGKIMSSIETQQSLLNELAKFADQHKWSAPWRRYTRYGFVKHHIDQQFEYFKNYQAKMQ